MSDLAANPASRLVADGPLFAAHAAIAARLAAVFPPARFQHLVVPARMTLKEWRRLVRRTPAIGLGWGGVRPDAAAGRLFTGSAVWTVYLVTRNITDTAGLIGDAFAPGLYGLTQVAAAALHGLTIGGAALPGAGSVAVTDIANLYAEEWGEDDTILAGVSLAVPFLLTDAEAIDDLLRLGVSWAFEDPPGSATQPIYNVRDP